MSISGGSCLLLVNLSAVDRLQVTQNVMTALLSYHNTENPMVDQGEEPGRLSSHSEKTQLVANSFWTLFLLI